jgi:large subunit ribosomal protein L32e
MTKQFLRRVWSRYSKLGRKRKSKQVWRKPKGRDNKMREKRRGYPAVVSIGYRKDSSVRGKIENKTPKLVYNLNDLNKLGNDELVIIGKVGKKKKMEIMKAVKENRIRVHNLNLEKSLKRLENKK